MASKPIATAAVLAAIEAEDVADLSGLLAFGVNLNINALGEHATHGQIAPLHLATRLAASGTVRALLDVGASVATADGMGWLSLHHLAASDAPGQSKAIVLQLLQQAGADADAATAYAQETALHLAARVAGTDAAFFALLVLAARDTARDASGRTPLHSLALAPLPSLGDPNARTPFVSAAVSSSVVAVSAASTASSTRLIELADILLRYTSISPQDADADGRSAADLASANGQLELAEWLRGAEARAARARRRRCCGRGGRYCWVQPLLVILITACGHACAAYYCLPDLPPAWPSIALATLCACVLVCGLTTALSDPGYLPKLAIQPHDPQPPAPSAPPQADPAESLTPPPPPADPRNGSSFCYACRAPKPLRAKHCRSCDRCVSQFDHHCPWLGSCVGVGNRVPFYLFVTLILIDCLALGAIAIASMIAAENRDELAWLLGAASPIAPPPLQAPPPETWLCDKLPAWWCEHTPWRERSKHAFRIVLTATSVVLAVPLAVFWLARTRNIFENLTTNERHNLKRYAHFRAAGGGFVNPFDRGLAGNCAHYFCMPCSGGASTRLQVVQVQGPGARSEGRAPLLHPS